MIVFVHTIIPNVFDSGESNTGKPVDDLFLSFVPQFPPLPTLPGSQNRVGYLPKIETLGMEIKSSLWLLTLSLSIFNCYSEAGMYSCGY